MPYDLFGFRSWLRNLRRGKTPIRPRRSSKGRGSATTLQVGQLEPREAFNDPLLSLSLLAGAGSAAAIYLNSALVAPASAGGSLGESWEISTHGAGGSDHASLSSPIDIGSSAPWSLGENPYGRPRDDGDFTGRALDDYFRSWDGNAHSADAPWTDGAPQPWEEANGHNGGGGAGGAEPSGEAHGMGGGGESAPGDHFEGGDRGGSTFGNPLASQDAFNSNGGTGGRSAPAQNAPGASASPIPSGTMDTSGVPTSFGSLPASAANGIATLQTATPSLGKGNSSDSSASSPSVNSQAPSTAATIATPADAVGRPIANIPLSFEQNVGQVADKGQQFLAHAGSSSLYPRPPRRW